MNLRYLCRLEVPLKHHCSYTQVYYDYVNLYLGETCERVVSNGL